MSEHKGWIGFDLDGTLAHYEGWKGTSHIGAPVPAMVERLRMHLAMGETVKIFTARIFRAVEVVFAKATDRLDALDLAVLEAEADLVQKTIWDWLEAQGLPRLEITCIKDFGMIRLYDDRCVQVETNTGKTATFRDQEIADLEAEVKTQRESFHHRYKADMRAIAMWQKAHPDQPAIWPDHGDLVVWLIDELARLRLCKECSNSPCTCIAF